jgi:hypothetical protein
MSIQYKIPEYAHVSQDCKDMLAKIFVANPAKVLIYIDLYQAQVKQLIVWYTDFDPFPNSSSE